MDDFATGYALGSDSNGNSGWGNFGDGIWAVIILGMLFGWGRGGYGFGGFGGGYEGGGLGTPSGQGWATRADINEGFALNGLQNGQTAITNAVTNGFHGVDNAICNLGYQTQQGFNTLASQLASCCCETQSAIQGVRYDIATSAAATQNTIQNTARDILENNNANTRAVLDALNQNYIRTLESENQSLKLAASQADQNAVLKAAMDANVAELLRRTGHDCPTAAYVVQPPTPVTFPNYCNPCGTCG